MNASRGYARLLSEVESNAASSAVESVPPSAERIIEALLFAGGSELSAKNACDIIRGLNESDFQICVNTLVRRYRLQNRPYALRQSTSGWTIELVSQYESLRRRFIGAPKATSLTVPALEVLSLVAYKQPIDRRTVDSLRGHDSGSILRQLIRLNLIAPQTSDGSKSETRYATTPQFLELFGMKSLDELPQTLDLEKV